MDTNQNQNGSDPVARLLADVDWWIEGRVRCRTLPPHGLIDAMALGGHIVMRLPLPEIFSATPDQVASVERMFQQADVLCYRGYAHSVPVVGEWSAHRIVSFAVFPGVGRAHTYRVQRRWFRQRLHLECTYETSAPSEDVWYLRLLGSKGRRYEDL